MEINFFEALILLLPTLFAVVLMIGIVLVSTRLTRYLDKKTKLYELKIKKLEGKI